MMRILFILTSILWNTCVIITFFSMKSLLNNYSYWCTTALDSVDLILGSTAIPLQVLTTELFLLTPVTS